MTSDTKDHPTYPPQRPYHPDNAETTGRLQVRLGLLLAILVLLGIVIAFLMVDPGSDTSDAPIATAEMQEAKETPRAFSEDNPFVKAEDEDVAAPIAFDEDNPFVRRNGDQAEGPISFKEDNPFTATGTVKPAGPDTATFAATADCPGCPFMLVITPGRTTMGISEREVTAETIPQLHVESELPRHGVTISQAFAIGQTEVTRAQFAAFVDATGYESRGCVVIEGENRDGQNWMFSAERSWQNPGFAQTDDDPVVCVSRQDAQTYADWLAGKTGKRYRLPSETEWEYAARAGADGARYQGTQRNTFCTHANVADKTHQDVFVFKEAHLVFSCATGHAYTAPVANFEPNSFGLYDALGNVREITADCWNINHWGKPLGSAPRRDGDCNSVVVKGGGWYDTPHNVRLARRMRAGENERRADQGFRVVKDVPLQQITP